MDLLLAEMSWEPWVGLGAICVALVGALITYSNRIAILEVEVRNLKDEKTQREQRDRGVISIDERRRG